MRVTWASLVAGRFGLACAGSCLALAAMCTPMALGRAESSAAPGARMTYITTLPGAGSVPEVMLAGADGSDPKPLGQASTAVLSPNGQLVAAVRSGGGSATHGSSLVLYSVAKKATRVLRVSSGQLTILAWSPDNQWIAVTDGDALVAVPLRGAARTLATGTINGASFAPTTPDRLVYAKAQSLLVNATVNLYKVNLHGGAAVELTHNGLSQYPLWGPDGIVFSGGQSHASTTYQLWLIKPGGASRARQLTNVAVSAPFDGLEPIAFSQDGKHLLANLVGADTSEAWTVDLGSSPAQVHQLGAAGATTIGNAISRDGNAVLLTVGSEKLSSDDFEGQSIAVAPWSGGLATTVVAHGAFASWNR